jgi:hypothetical protein
MAFTKTPTMDTYSSEEIDLTREIALRAGNVANKDEDFVNVFLEDIKSKYAGDHRSFIIKRAGSSLLEASVTTGVVRGIHYWADLKRLYYSVGSTLYIKNFGTGVVTTISSFFGTTSGTIGFADYIYDNGTQTLVISDGTNLYLLDSSNTKTTVTDPDLPSPHEPHIQFLDGYIFLIKSNTGDIYGCEANDPTTWDPSNIINAEIEADVLVRLHKINNYLIAFGTHSIEYLWDAGNATGSPLQRNDTPVKRISYIAGLSQTSNISFFIGRDYRGKFNIYKMVDFKCDEVSTESISKYLTTTAISSDISTWTGAMVAYMGHTFYVVVAGTRTYCMDVASGIWTRLTYQAQTTFPILQSTVIQGTSAAYSIFFLNDNTSAIYKFDDTMYTDNGINFSCIIVTESCDFGTINRKNMHRLSIFGDRPPISATILVQWTDDDYQTYNTGVNVDLNQDLPCARKLGNFRQRSFRLTFTSNTLMRLQKMVADINKGNS